MVGAGLAGLVAAGELKAGGRSVVLLEARDRVGGRLLGHPLGDGKAADLGGEYFGERSTAIAQLAHSLGIRRFPSHDEGERITFYRGRAIRYRGLVPRVSPAVVADLGQALLRIERMAAAIPDGEPWTAPRAREWDSQTLYDWSRRNMATAGARSLVALGTECAYCASPRDLSLLHVLYYAKVSGGFAHLMDVSGGIQRYRFEGGAHQVPIRLAERLEDELRTGSPVRCVRSDGDSVVASGPGFEARGGRIVIALPPTLTGRIVYEPELPAHRDQAMQRMPAGSAIKCLAVYDEPWWRADGLSGQATSLDGPVRVTFDGSPSDGSPGVLSAFVVGTAARRMARVAPRERREAVVGALARAFGPRARGLAGFVQQSWIDEEYTRGCYHGFAPPGTYTAYGPSLRAPIGRIHWAGSETGIHQMGSMGGAVDSGRRAAREVLAADAWSEAERSESLV